MPASRSGHGHDSGSAPRRDPTAIPAFLREREDERLAIGAGRAEDARLLALPRPATPPPTAAAQIGPTFDPAALPMPSLSRRRVFTAAGVLLAGWLAMSFVRQVGDASAASSRAEQLRAANAALKAEIERLEEDLTRVQDRTYILLQGRGVGLGGRGEIAFALAGDAPTLPPDAPGSAAARLGAATHQDGPLDAWLEVLFGPD